MACPVCGLTVPEGLATIERCHVSDFNFYFAGLPESRQTAGMVLDFVAFRSCAQPLLWSAVLRLFFFFLICWNWVRFGCRRRLGCDE